MWEVDRVPELHATWKRGPARAALGTSEDGLQPLAVILGASRERDDLPLGLKPISKAV